MNDACTFFLFVFTPRLLLFLNYVCVKSRKEVADDYVLTRRDEAKAVMDDV